MAQGAPLAHGTDFDARPVISGNPDEQSYQAQGYFQGVSGTHGDDNGRKGGEIGCPYPSKVCWLSIRQRDKLPRLKESYPCRVRFRVR